MADRLGTVCVYAIGLGLVASGASLVLRFRRARGDDRRQLLWLVFAVAPLPLYVVVAFVSSRNGADVVTLLATGGFVMLIPVAAGLSVLRYRLYDVERFVSTSVTWVLLSTVLVATYACVVWLGARAVPSGPVSPVLSATVGAVAAAALAFPLRSHLQDAVDRRFDRRAYDARRVIGAALAAEEAGVDVEALLREALHDPVLTVAYPGLTRARRRCARRRRPARPGGGADRLRPGPLGRGHRPPRGGPGGRRARQHPAARRARPPGRGARGVAGAAADRAARGADPDRAGPARRRPAVPARAQPSSCSRPS